MPLTNVATRRSHPLFVCLGLCVSCGPESSTGGDTDPTTSVSSTDHMPEEATETDDTHAETETETETEPGEVCDPPVDDEPGPAMATITIRNDTEEPRFITPWSPFTCNYAKLEILIDGESVHWDHSRVFNYGCDACGWGCSDGGDMGLIINPGATAEVLWNGAAWTMTDLSEACALEVCEQDPHWRASNGLPSECEVLRNLDAVEYVARVQVYDACPLGAGGEACACDQDVCEVFFYEPGVGDYTAEATATFPDGATIVLE
jgi:hypothetical protein